MQQPPSIVPIQVGEEVYLKGVRCKVSYINKGKERITLVPLGNRGGINPQLLGKHLREQVVILEGQLESLRQALKDAPPPEETDDSVDAEQAVADNPSV